MIKAENENKYSIKVNYIRNSGNYFSKEVYIIRVSSKQNQYNIVTQ